jgi:hypothetical protein
MPASAKESPKNLAFRRAAWHSSAANYDNTAHLVTYGDDGTYPNSWISQGSGREWIYIDLGAASQIAVVTVCWGSNYALCYHIQTADNAGDWTTIASAKGAPNSCIETKIPAARARYVRILCEESSGENYIIREVKVFGTNDLQYKLAPLPPPEADGRQKLTGGNWKVERAAKIKESGEVLSRTGYDDSGWLPAVVSGTVLVSYLKAGAVCDPNYDDWQNQVFDAYFTADFWYRNSFVIPADKKGKEVFLNFDAVNWKADVYFNGHYLPNPLPGRIKSIEGAFIRAKFNITKLANFGAENCLAVYIYKNDTPEYGYLMPGPNGPVFRNRSDKGEKIMVSTQGLAEGPWNNGGRLGLDNPTFHASVGWDWLPTIRGRNAGIYNEVYLSYSGGVEICDPWMETKLDIKKKRARIGAVNLALGKKVAASVNADEVQNIVSGSPDKEWLMKGGPGDCFIIDLGAEKKVGSVFIDWGEVPDALAYETQYAAKFKLESSRDGISWTNFDAYPGGMVDTKYFGLRKAGPNPGTDVFTGQAVTNAINGPTGQVLIDLSAQGFGVRPISVPVPAAVRYLRFTIAELMKSKHSRHGTLPPRIRAVRVYGEAAEAVAQSTVRTFELDDTKAVLTFRTELHNSRSCPQTAVLEGLITPAALIFPLP